MKTTSKLYKPLLTSSAYFLLGMSIVYAANIQAQTTSAPNTKNSQKQEHITSIMQASFSSELITPEKDIEVQADSSQLQSKSQAASTSGITSTGFNQPSYVPGKSGNATNTGLEGVKIDKHTGKLYIELTDVSIPGDGLELLINRSYQKSGLPNYSVPHNMGNWSLEVPRIVVNSGGNHFGPASSGKGLDAYRDPKNRENCFFPSSGTLKYVVAWNNTIDYARPWWGVTLSIPGQGDRELLFRVTINDDNSFEFDPDQLEPANERFNKQVRWATKDNWIASCEVGHDNKRSKFVVKSPNGKTYSFDSRPSTTATSARDSWNRMRVYPLDDFSNAEANWINLQHFYATKVEDLHGNTINYNYGVTSHADTYYPSYELELNNITTSDGRVIDIEYNNSQAIWSGNRKLIKKISVGGRNWIYGYDSKHRLSFVTRPDGTQWQYSYAGDPQNLFVPLGVDGTGNWNTDKPTLTRIKNPLGGIIDFEYAERTINTLGGFSTTATPPAERFKIITKVLLSGKDIEPSHTNYSYVFNDNINLTTVSTEDKVERYYFLRGSPYGYLILHAIKDPLKAGWKSKDVSEINYSLVKAGFATGSTYANKSPRRDSRLHPMLPVKQEVTRNGAIFNTAFDDYDIYNKPKKITESSNISNGLGGKTVTLRTTTHTYENHKAPWLIGLPKSQVVNGIQASSNQYNDYGKPIVKTKFGVNNTYTYDNKGNLKSKANAKGKTTTYANYYRGVPVTVTYPDNTTVTRVSNAYGEVTSLTDANGKTTQYKYDNLGRVTKTDYPRGADEITDWSNVNKKITTRSNQQTTEQLDGFGRVIKNTVKDTSTNKMREIVTNYDYAGRKIFTSNPVANATTDTLYGWKTSYDELNRVILKNHTGDNVNIAITYLDDQNAETITNENSNVTTKHYRSYGSPNKRDMIKIDAPEQVSMEIIRDVFGNVEKIKQGNSQRSFAYDAHYYLHKRIDPEIGETVFGRDADGLLTSKQVGGEPAINYEYDTMGRLKKTQYPSDSQLSSVSHVYDKAGNVVATNALLNVDGQTWNAKLGFEYDENSNLTQETFDYRDGAVKGRLIHVYNALDHNSVLAYPDGKPLILLSPNAFGEPTQLRGYASNITYHPSGQLKSMTLGNGVITTYAEETGRSRLQSIIASKDNASLINLGYTYDALGNISSIVDGVADKRSVRLTYDGVERLNLAVGDWGNASYNYDQKGNITNLQLGTKNLTYHYDSNTDLLSSIAGNTNFNYQYDGYGNITNDGENTYNYDPSGALIQTQGTDTARHFYDGDNRLFHSLSKGDGRYYFRNADGLLISEYNQVGDLIKDYIYHDTMLVASVYSVKLTIHPPPW
ncbi:MAG: RHS repeat protein [Gammaproteobacteria bacterium]|nr:RHS repeat protein [Gammaproteobacteria bacterium]